MFPHPYCGTYTGISNSYFPEKRLKSIFSIIDGIEVINAENLNIWNLRSALLGFNLDIRLNRYINKIPYLETAFDELEPSYSEQKKHTFDNK
jgi:hypothetical protein